MPDNWMLKAWGLGLAGTVLLLSGTGCSQPAAPSKTPVAKAKKSAHDHEHDHPHEGPHQGALAEWGDEEYHPEFTVDHKTQEAIVYILDGRARKAKPIAARSITLSLKTQPPVTITLEARPQEGDPAGTSSRFVGKHPELGKEQGFAGTISGEVNGKPYSGDFKEEAHDHKHDKK